MTIRSLFFCILLSLWVSQSFADELIWSGDINADGTPSPSIPLTLHQTYQIKVSRFVNLGKWRQNGEELAYDACYEFSRERSHQKFEFLKNSQNISVCDGIYHLDHIYISEPFVAKQNRIHFWVYDTDYENNKGSFHVEIIH